MADVLPFHPKPVVTPDAPWQLRESFPSDAEYDSAIQRGIDAMQKSHAERLRLKALVENRIGFNSGRSSTT